MIVIFRGPSGSGKTTLGNFLADKSSLDLRIEGPGAAVYGRHGIGTVLSEIKVRISRNWREHVGGKLPDMGDTPVTICSSDDYYMVRDPETDKLVYKFDPAYLTKAHATCMRKFVAEIALGNRAQTIIVDNTNCSIAEVAPYAQLAGAFDHDLAIITLLVDPYLAWGRNTHDVPPTNVVKQHLALLKSIEEWPPWWPQHVFPMPSYPYLEGLDSHGG